MATGLANSRPRIPQISANPPCRRNHPRQYWQSEGRSDSEEVGQYGKPDLECDEAQISFRSNLGQHNNYSNRNYCVYMSSSLPGRYLPASYSTTGLKSNQCIYSHGVAMFWELVHESQCRCPGPQAGGGLLNIDSGGVLAQSRALWCW